MEYTPTLLICDDESALLKNLSMGFKDSFDIQTTDRVDSAMQLSERTKFDIAVIDLKFKGQVQNGVHLLDHFNRTSPSTFLVILSGDDSMKRVIEAMRRRHFRFIEKEDGFRNTLYDCLLQIKQMVVAMRGNQQFLTTSDLVKTVVNTLDRVAKKSTAASLIFGESGTGKGHLIEYLAKVNSKNLVSVNMANIPHETAESTLFGHVRGAFTGATNNTTGLIETAHGGYFFLDEIGECSLKVQAKILRAIENGEIQPLGSKTIKKVNVQFFAATHCDLEEMVSEGTFRFDLYQRLSTFVVKMPTLAERPEDILLLANMFIKDKNCGGPNFFITSSGESALLNYKWPGNVRELGHVMERIVVLSDQADIDEKMVLAKIAMGNSKMGQNQASNFNKDEDLKRKELLKALKLNNGNKAQTARFLNRDESTLYRQIKHFKIESHDYT